MARPPPATKICICAIPAALAEEPPRRGLPGEDAVPRARRPLVNTGEHTDVIAVGSRAAMTGTTATAWTNTGGTVNAITAKLTVIGGTGPGAITGNDLLAVDDTGDTADGEFNTGIGSHSAVFEERSDA